MFFPFFFLFVSFPWTSASLSPSFSLSPLSPLPSSKSSSKSSSSLPPRPPRKAQPKQSPLLKDGISTPTLQNHANIVKAFKSSTPDKLINLSKTVPFSAIAMYFNSLKIDNRFLILVLQSDELIGLFIELLRQSSKNQMKMIAIVAIENDFFGIINILLRNFDDFDVDFADPIKKCSNDSLDSDDSDDTIDNANSSLLLIAMRKWSYRYSPHSNEILLSLIRKSNSLFLVDQYASYTALLYASMSGRLELVQTVIERAIELNQLTLIIDQVDSPVLESSLHKASKNRFTDISNLLIEMGANTSLLSHYGETAQQLCCHK